MKILYPFILLFFPVLVLGQTPCESGMAGGFPCEGLDLQDQVSLSEFGSTFANDSWGWTDPDTGKEYAIIGLGDGTGFVDISDPLNVVYLGKLPTHTTSSVWRDIKVYANHAFVVSEADGHGMQVFDLTRLRTVASPPETFTEDAHYDGFGSAHNIALNTDTGFAYAVGTDTFGGGIHMVSVQNPTTPQFAGGFSDAGYTHDAQIVTYSGPDADYTGSELFFGSNEDIVVIIDVTDKTNPVIISSMNYSDTGYTHQGWLTEDQDYFLLCDEVDEIIFGFETKTVIFDVSDLDFPEFSFNYFSQNPATDHNGYVVDNTFYLASYRAGLRVLDITNIASQDMSETGYFDTVPGSDNAGTGGGAWNVYPFFESGNLVISDQEGGFYLVRDNSVLDTPEFEQEPFATYPNPVNNTLFIEHNNQPITAVKLYNTMGQLVLDTNYNNGPKSMQLDVSLLSPGMYLLQINNQLTKKIIKQ